MMFLIALVSSLLLGATAYPNALVEPRALNPYCLLNVPYLAIQANILNPPYEFCSSFIRFIPTLTYQVFAIKTDTLTTTLQPTIKVVTASE